MNLVHVMEYAKGMCAQVQEHTQVLHLSMHELHTSGYSLNAVTLVVYCLILHNNFSLLRHSEAQITRPIFLFYKLPTLKAPDED